MHKTNKGSKKKKKKNVQYNNTKAKIITNKTSISMVKLVTYSKHKFKKKNLIFNGVGISIRLKNTFFNTKGKPKKEITSFSKSNYEWNKTGEAAFSLTFVLQLMG